jgi:hypothetical protein
MPMFTLSDISSYKTPELNPRHRRIVSVDGEGETRNGRHAYTLLAGADDQGWSDSVSHDRTERPMTANRQPNHGLSTRKCLDFLLSIPKSKHDLVIAFAFTYDATKILTDLPIAALITLKEKEVVDWCEYRIRWRPRKWLEITDTSSGKLNAAGRREYTRRVKVWDTFSYFQTSFVNALDKSKSLFTDKEALEYIDAMKNNATI